MKKYVKILTIKFQVAFSLLDVIIKCISNIIRGVTVDIINKRINFLGDSITEGCGISDEDNCFVALIAKKYGAICRNYGIGGTRIARQKEVSADPIWDRDFCARVLEMDSDADIVVVFGGTNDFAHGDAPLGSMEDRTPYTFYGALHTLYSSLVERFPSALITVLTPLHRLNEDNLRGDGFKETDTGDLKCYVEIIKEVAEFYSLPVLDLYAVSGLQPKVPTIQDLYMPDGLHLNDAGHKILAKKIAHYLYTL